MTKIERPKIVCELGINANGNFALLRFMARRALFMGADYIKLQTRTPRVCVPRDQWDKPREWFNGEMITYIEYKERMELTRKQLYVFGQEFEGRWITSFWDEESVDFVNDVFRDKPEFLPVYAKIPSAKITDLNLVRKVINLNCPLMVSTGMSTDEEIDTLLNTIPASKKCVIFHCNSSYPTDDSEINLQAIPALHRRMKYLKWHETGEDTKFIIGFSSHSSSPFPAIGAMYMGAKWIEVHYTKDRSMKGTDQAASLEDKAIELLVREAKKFPDRMGDGEHKLYDSELSARAKLRG